MIITPGAASRPKTDVATGEYGQVLEHPQLRGLVYMVIGESRWTTDHGGRQFRHLWATVLRDDRGAAFATHTEVGSVVEISDSGWLIHE